MSLCTACSKNSKPEITSFTVELSNEGDSSDVYHFDVVATDNKWIENIKVEQIENGIAINTFSSSGSGAPTKGLSRIFTAPKNTIFQLKVEVSDNRGNKTTKTIDVN